MHPIDHGTRINHDNRVLPSACVTLAVSCGGCDVPALT
jgi:hypothetical protein